MTEDQKLLSEELKLLRGEILKYRFEFKKELKDLWTVIEKIVTRVNRFTHPCLICGNAATHEGLLDGKTVWICDNCFKKL